MRYSPLNTKICAIDQDRSPSKIIWLLSSETPCCHTWSILRTPDEGSDVIFNNNNIKLYDINKAGDRCSTCLSTGLWRHSANEASPQCSDRCIYQFKGTTCWTNVSVSPEFILTVRYCYVIFLTSSTYNPSCAPCLMRIKWHRAPVSLCDGSQAFLTLN